MKHLSSLSNNSKSMVVLVATTGQVDFSLFMKMNIRCDTIIANQHNYNCFSETYINGYRVRMITTDTKGVGINRNLAMQLSEADICLLADDDVIYTDSAIDDILKAFEEEPMADIIGFSLSGNIPENARINVKNGRTLRNFGAACMAYRNISIKKACLSFSRLFGGGSKFSSGEDSLFCVQARAAGLKIYQRTEIIGIHGGRESTWFNGYTDKFYRDKGVFFAAAYPRTKIFMCAQLLFRRPELYKNGNKSFAQALKLMLKGFDVYENISKKRS